MAPQSLTNLDDHPITGYLPDGDLVNIPLISLVAPPPVPEGGELWMGGCVDGVELPADFTFVLSLYTHERYVLPPGCVRTEWPLFDSAEVPPARDLYLLARQVNAWRARGKTLVHCQAGLNRSGLVTALALILAGATPAEALATLRAARDPYVLCNKAFEAWLSLQTAGACAHENVVTYDYGGEVPGGVACIDCKADL